MRSGQFRLPGKKVLKASDAVIEVVLIDVTEQPIERPKKSSNGITVERRNDTHRKRR